MKRQPKEPPQQAKHKSKKNTARWCKGKVGREHDPKASWSKYYWVNACTNCGKQLDYYFTSWLLRDDEAPPKWLPICVNTKRKGF